MTSVFTIAPGTAFLDTLAAGLLARYGDDPLDLGRVTVLLPTRRACRALDDAFLRLRGGRALMAPAARAIGDIEEDELAALSGGEAGALAARDLALPPAVPPLRRQLLLAGLILDMDGRRARGPALRDREAAPQPVPLGLASMIRPGRRRGNDGREPRGAAEHPIAISPQWMPM